MTSMLEIKEVLRRREAGASVRWIAREMGMDRRTVGRYVEAIAAAGIGDGTEVDDAVLASLAQAVQGRPAVEPSAGWQALSSQRERIAGWLLQTPPLVLTRVQKLLLREGCRPATRRCDGSWSASWACKQARGDGAAAGPAAGRRSAGALRRYPWVTEGEEEVGRGLRV